MKLDVLCGRTVQETGTVRVICSQVWHQVQDQVVTVASTILSIAVEEIPCGMHRGFLIAAKEFQKSVKRVGFSDVLV